MAILLMEWNKEYLKYHQNHKLKYLNIKMIKLFNIFGSININ